MNAANQTLTEHQREVAAEVLAHESTRRNHVVIALSGAHAYGFPSPDSDLDLKCVPATASTTRWSSWSKSGAEKRRTSPRR